jgi:predicted Zn-dependent protease
MGHQAAARAVLETALAAKPEQVDLLVALAEVAIAEGRRDEALALVEKARALKPGHEDANRVRERLMTGEGGVQ